MKGVMFSFIIVLIALALMSLIAVQKSLVSFYGEKLAIETRVNSMNSLYDSIVTDSGKALGIIAKRAASAADSFVITNGRGLPEANQTLLELIVNGTLNNTAEILMEDTTIVDWKNKMEDVGSLSGFNTNITILELKIMPYDSWNILSTIYLSISLADKNRVASLDRNATVSQPVSIEGLEDPLVPLNTLGRATNVIVRSPYWGNFTQNLGGGNWDIENLKKDIENSYYHPSTKGASFLDRLEGKPEVQSKYRSQTTETIGLESFVNKGYFSAVGISVDIEKTNVDHLYFSGDPHPGKKVRGLETTSFRIDSELCGNQNHTDIYGVSELLV